MPTTIDSRQIEIKNYPTVKPSLLLDFTNGRVLDSRISFSRGGVATRTNEKGLIELVPINTPRFEYDPSTLECMGLMFESSRSNIITFSEQFDNAAWTKSSLTVSANGSMSPDGTVTMDKIIPDNAQVLSGPFISQNITKSASATAIAYSIYVKAGEFNRARLIAHDVGNSANQATLTVSLTDGSIVNAAAVGGTFTAATSQVTWISSVNAYRVSLLFTSGTETSIRFQLRVLDSVATTGNGTSGIYAWGAQVEVGTFVSSYIPTTTASQTRNADLAVMTGSNFSSWYRADEGTFVTTGSVPTLASAITLVGVSDGTADERIIINTSTAGGGTAVLTVTDGTVTQASVNMSSISANTFFSVAGAYKTNDFAASKNGNVVVTDTSGTLPTVDRLYIGATSTGSVNRCIVQKVLFYPKRLTNSELQTLSRL